METVKVNEPVQVVHGAVNMGLVRTGDGFVCIDTGLDKRAGKALVNLAEDGGAPICAIINTHAHADHFGGNEAILARFPDVRVFAPVDEGPVIRRPRFEPEYLWQGTLPFPDLQNKFLMASPSPVHEVFNPGDTVVIGDVEFQSVPFPGHAHGQAGILVHHVLFAADAYFDEEVTDKHGIPYLVDAAATCQSAEAVLDTAADYYVPGHGEVTRNPRRHVDHLVNRHKEAAAFVTQLTQSGCTLEQAVQQVALQYHLSFNSPGAYLLVRTSVGAYLTQAIEQQIARADVDSGQLVFRTIHP